MAATFEYLREDVLSLGEDVMARARERNLPEATARLVSAATRLAEGKLVAVVCGEFNRGKSSLLNALLDDPDDLFPTAVVQKTRLISTVAYGETEQVFVQLTRPDGTAERRPITRAQISDYAAEPDDGAAADRDDGVIVEILLPEPRLKSGLLLVDTPGVGGIYQAHSRITMGFLPIADAIVFVTSMGPMTAKELTFLSTAADQLTAADRRDDLLVVLNKIDESSDYSVQLSETRRRVAERTGRTPAEIPVFGVSAENKLHYLRTGDLAYLEESRIAELETALWGQLTRRRVRVLLGEALRAVDETADVLLRPLLEVEEALRDQTGRRLKELEQEAGTRAVRLGQLGGEGALWRQEIKDQLAELGREMTARATSALEETWRRAQNELLAQEWYLVQPDRLEDQLNTELALAMTGVDDWGGRRAAAIQRACAVRYGLSMRGIALGRYTGASIVNLPGYDKLEPTTRRVFHEPPEPRPSSADHGFVSRTGGRQPGLLARGVIRAARWLGGEAAELKTARYFGYEPIPESKMSTGYWTEIKEGISTAELNLRRGELQAVLAEIQLQARDWISREVTKRVKQFTEATAGEMASLITMETEALADTLRRLTAVRAQEEEEASARIDELMDEQLPLHRARRAVAWLTEECEGLQGSHSEAG